MRRLIGSTALLLLASLMSLPATPGLAQSVAALPAGKGRATAPLGATTLTVFTYRPASCTPHLVLLVFHGAARDAAAYRDHAVSLADRACAVVFAPEFDRTRFPRALYQYGGSARETPGSRTIDLVPPLIAWARGQAAAAGLAGALPVVLIGHSAGAQFLGRVAAFVPTGAVSIILANPSTWVMPSTSISAPFGFGDTAQASDVALRAYLAQPVTVLLGTADTGTKDLAVSPGAMAQGPNRYMRGLNAMHAAQSAAQQHGWPLNWQLSDVPGVGHQATAMFDSPQALAAVMRH